jgi:hypothetical protein
MTAGPHSHGHTDIHAAVQHVGVMKGDAVETGDLLVTIKEDEKEGVGGGIPAAA